MEVVKQWLTALQVIRKFLLVTLVKYLHGCMQSTLILLTRTLVISKEIQPELPFSLWWMMIHKHCYICSETSTTLYIENKANICQKKSTLYHLAIIGNDSVSAKIS